MDIRSEGAHAFRYRLSMVSCPSMILTEELMHCGLKVFSPKIKEMNERVS